MKKNIIISGILGVAMTFAIGCGSKDNIEGRSNTTYNTVRMTTQQTKMPTVIVTETKAPVVEVKETETLAPKPTATPQVKKKNKATKKSIKKKTAAPTPSPAEKKKVASTPAPTKKPAVKKTHTPEPKMTAEATKKPAKKQVKKSVKNIKSMKSVLTTVSLYMAEGQTYDPKDEECYYDIMYMLANNVAYTCGKSQYHEVDGMVYVGQKAMQSLSAAAFADHNVISKVAKKYSDMIMYDKDKQLYSVYGSDAGDVTGKIKKSVDNGNGTYTVSFDLLTGDGKEVLSSYEYTLVKNQSEYAKVTPNFYYRIKAVKKLTE